MTWVHLDIPRRFRHVHRQWADMSDPERRAFKSQLKSRRQFVRLSFFEDWEDFNAERTSLIRMGGWK